MADLAKTPSVGEPSCRFDEKATLLEQKYELRVTPEELGTFKETNQDDATALAEWIDGVRARAEACAVPCATTMRIDEARGGSDEMHRFYCRHCDFRMALPFRAPALDRARFRVMVQRHLQSDEHGRAVGHVTPEERDALFVEGETEQQSQRHLEK